MVFWPTLYICSVTSVKGTEQVKLKYSLKIDKCIKIGNLPYLIVIKIKFTQCSIMLKIFNDADQVLTKTQRLHSRHIVHGI